MIIVLGQLHPHGTRHSLLVNYHAAFLTRVRETHENCLLFGRSPRERLSGGHSAAVFRCGGHRGAASGPPPVDAAGGPRHTSGHRGGQGRTAAEHTASGQ